MEMQIFMPMHERQVLPCMPSDYEAQLLQVDEIQPSGWLVYHQSIDCEAKYCG